MATPTYLHVYVYLIIDNRGLLSMTPCMCVHVALLCVYVLMKYVYTICVQLVIVQWNFFEFNVLEGYSALYGAYSWHW